MLEDSGMEKKPRNCSQGPPKPSGASESKKTPDVQNSKPFPRSNRKREPANGVPTKNEQRKPPPQKGKVCDKRPRPRGLYYGNKKEGPQMNDEEFEAEFGSLFLPGSKKQNLNHLLNFHYEPRGDAASTSRQNLPTHNVSTRSLMSTHAHKYNKEQFLQANCQFVVRYDGDYGCYMGDPDLLVDWNLVELIRVDTSEDVNCPICLYPPVAGKITRCGHIYCWTCILHYLALSDKTWRKCPICYEAIHRKDLKSVEPVDRPFYSTGQEITMQLMKREKGSLIAAPVNQYSARMSKIVLDNREKEIDTVFSKLLLAQKSDIDEIIQREYDQLQCQVAETKGCPELCFVEEALQCLVQRKSYMETGVAPPLTTSEIPTPTSDQEMENVQNTFEPEILTNNVEVGDLDIENLAVSQPSKTFYFFQSTDGQHIYLHSINVKMLEMTYGSLDNCPATIKGKIVEKESGSMTGELRKRLKYLQHVPITCQFEVAELELAPPLISPEAAIAFHDQIEMRKKRRYKQARAEKRREKKIEEHERRQFGRGPAPNLRIESHFHFPECGELTEPPRPPGNSEPDRNSEASSRSQSPHRRAEDHISNTQTFDALSFETPPDDNGMSFAQMLREGKSIKTNDSSAWPTVGDTGDGAHCVGYWVQPRRQRQESVTVAYESDTENYAFSPPAKSSFNIAEALETAARMEKDKESVVGRKKKKKQQKLLFATGMQCPGN